MRIISDQRANHLAVGGGEIRRPAVEGVRDEAVASFHPPSAHWIIRQALSDAAGRLRQLRPHPPSDRAGDGPKNYHFP